MIILTDNIGFAERCVPLSAQWEQRKVSSLPTGQAVLADELFECDTVMQTEVSIPGHWDFLFAINRARHSQYDILSKLAVSDQPPPDRVICCAGSGNEFHGFKGRGWQASEGNIHLSAHIRPQQVIEGAAVGYIIAAAVAALKTVDSFDLQAAETGIKWVNDILIEGAKVGGVLARLQMQGRTTESAVVGIGLNIEQKPPVKRDACVPDVAALANFSTHPGGITHLQALPKLMQHLGVTLDQLRNGQFIDLLEFYRNRSLIIGREVSIYEDDNKPLSEPLDGGLVESIGPSLELFLKGRKAAVTKGRLRLD